MTTTKKKIDERAVEQVVAYRLGGGWRVEMAGIVAAAAPKLADALRDAADRLEGVDARGFEHGVVRTPPSTRLLTPKDVAERLSVSLRIAQELLGKGAIKSVRVGQKMLRCEPADIERYIAEQRAKGIEL